MKEQWFEPERLYENVAVRMKFTSNVSGNMIMIPENNVIIFYVNNAYATCFLMFSNVFRILALMPIGNTFHWLDFVKICTGNVINITQKCINKMRNASSLRQKRTFDKHASSLIDEIA